MAAKPKFNIGDTVKFLSDFDSEAGQILSFSFDGIAYRYTFSSEVYDPSIRKMINGIKNCLESELVEVKSTA